MATDYKRMYTCLAAAVDRALTELEEHREADRIHTGLQKALYEAEEIYLNTDGTEEAEK